MIFFLDEVSVIEERRYWLILGESIFLTGFAFGFDGYVRKDTFRMVLLEDDIIGIGKSSQRSGILGYEKLYKVGIQ